ncbi:two-component sensor histidine kinase [Photobacterium damselae subsp. piscicida]|uniref:histidine kinase n=2 Tax=Photobacterium damselae TaxID=38293 RepID=A0A1Q9H5B0_PHODP|nr:cache domain-containing protein [Photobacterium damselae]OLQ83021.1 two-component sensor histidine kinase [Photobacterium damselae subsp. piscicida]QOD53872.1 two-component sensor histidine kinase [Photobacterium damselae subsp. piscicida]QOD57702.1 two-component sensor histidine kinase [Photobacterium damselae subsp. piscicida]TFZ57478.1 two-component sensor histidine kinase [Photobacterium damselae subsp. piscicida]TJZ92778.1 two-component sensor histidine kinase [Photobacterium damselae 
MKLRTFVATWLNRFRTMVRYRLLVLTSVPIFLTMLALIGITLYWTLMYTWQSALMNVRADLAVAHHSMELLQREQWMQLTSLTHSYDFQQRLRHDESSLTRWVPTQAKNYDLDFVIIHPASQLAEFPKSNRKLLLAGQQQTFFEVLDSQELYRLNPDLPARAQIPMLRGNQIERRGLVSRSLIPIFNDRHELQWIIDGGMLLNNSTQLVDRIRDLVYASNTLPKGSIGTVTLFMDDLRVSTNVPLDSSMKKGRAIGTSVSEQVKQDVLKDGQVWVDRAYVYDAWYVSAYEPLRNYDGKVIGILYTGYLEWPLVRTYLTNIIEMGIAICIVLLLSSIIVYRGSRDLFLPIEKIHHVVRAVQLGLKKRIGKLDLSENHELQILGRQFDSMLDLLDQRNEAIKQAAIELEDKVDARTHSLHEKTEELERHIQLLNQARHKLVNSEKLAALGELTAGIAHEINNPIAVILGNVELIQFELGDGTAPIKDELEAIHEQIDRIRNITRSLLQYSRQGGVQDEIIWQHINPIIEESLTLVRSGTKKLDIKIETDLQAKCSVEVNRHQLLQVLVNLQMNGVHAMNDSGILQISTQDWIEGKTTIGAIIKITDHGCGISEQNLTRIFNPFFTTRRSGTGLGLSVSQGIIESIGGEIRVQSEVGVGTTFSIFLHEKAMIEQEGDILLQIKP